MNLTIDQMDVINFRLTEVSLELLGNKFYDIFGRKCDTLGSLYRSKSGSTNGDLAADSDLVKILNIEDAFSAFVPEDNRIGDSGEQIANCNIEGNHQGSSSTESDDSDDPDGGINQAENRSKEDKITKIINEVEEEYAKLLMASESTKMKYFITHKHRMDTEYEDEYEICNRYHVEENARLMAQSDAFIKLIKYIKCDSRNAFKMGEIAANILKVKDHISDSATSGK